MVLIKHRCSLVRFDGEIDDRKLRTGSVDACLPIIRFLFVNFSEALTGFLDGHGHRFHNGMSNTELIKQIMGCWHLVSPQPQLGNMSIDKMISRNRWGVDRLLFTMQCLLDCSEKHLELQAKTRAFSNDGSTMSFSSLTSSFSMSDAVRPFDKASGSAANQQSTLQRLVHCYREQLDSLKTTQPINGAAEQAKWMALFDSTRNKEAIEEEPLLIDPEQQHLYQDALARADLGMSASAAGDKMAERFEAAMMSLYLGQEYELEAMDDFDDSLFNTPFLGERS